jgi:hypothetical protein
MNPAPVAPESKCLIEIKLVISREIYLIPKIILSFGAAAT